MTHYLNHNILVLGKIQAGKTALIQTFQKYAHQDPSTDHRELGNGTFAKTKKVKTVYFRPKYGLLDRNTEKYTDYADADADRMNQSLDVDVTNKIDDAPRHIPIARTPTDAVEFTFLDTPGMCSDDGTDKEVGRMITTALAQIQSLSLILIVVNPHDPLTADLEFSLQFYSEVLRGLCSRIVFVFTHMDYFQHRPGSLEKGLNLEVKAQILGSYFQSDAQIPIQPLHIALDLSPKKQSPMVENHTLAALLQILRLAVDKHAIRFNMSKGNMSRIKQLTQLARLSGFYAEQHQGPWTDMFTRRKVPKLEAAVQTTPTEINIVVIGDIRSGKSSLIAVMESMAESIIKDRLEVNLPSGMPSEIIQKTSFLFDLHSVEIRRRKGFKGIRTIFEKLFSGDVIDMMEAAQKLDREEFDSLLDLKQGWATISVARPPFPKRYKFNVFEAPDLQDDTQDLQERVIAVYQTIVEAHKDIHQVIVTLAPDSITNSTRETIEALVRVYPEVVKLFVFVHTKVNYCNFHHSNTDFHDGKKEKKKQLQSIIGVSPAVFMIDCSHHEAHPVQRAITQNIIGSIFSSAIRSKPKFSVLVLGKTQSGKSAFIENLRKYADPTYIINESCLGTGLHSKTETTQRIVIDTDLPVYEVVRSVSGEVINLDGLASDCQYMDEYSELIALRETTSTLRQVRRPPPLPSGLIEFTCVDTPGLNDTGARDVSFANNILDELIATRTFNLILVVVSRHHPLTMEYRLALEYYAKVLQGLHSNLAFLYTHVGYFQDEVSHRKLQQDMAIRREAFEEIFLSRGHSRAPSAPRTAGEVTIETAGRVGTATRLIHKHFSVDMNTQKRPVMRWLTLKTIREILQTAMSNRSAELDTSLGNLERMRSIVHPDAANQNMREQYNQDMAQRQQERQQQQLDQQRHGMLEGMHATPLVHVGSSLDLHGYTLETLVEEAVRDDCRLSSAEDMASSTNSLSVSVPCSSTSTSRSYLTEQEVSTMSNF